MRLEDVKVGARVRIRPVNGSMYAGAFKRRGQEGTVDGITSDGWVRVRLDGLPPRVWPYGSCTPDMLQPVEEARR